MERLVERKRNSKTNYKEIVLKTIFMTVVLSVAVVAPNALKVFGYLKKKDIYQTGFRIRNSTEKLIKVGYVIETKHGLKLTAKREMELLRFSDFRLKKAKKWDSLWTVVSFDLPVNKNKIRDAIRFQLKRIGFVQLQKSVWVFPYDCQELVYLIKTEWKLKDEIVYIRAKYISREKILKKYFSI